MEAKKVQAAPSASEGKGNQGSGQKKKARWALLLGGANIAIWGAVALWAGQVEFKDALNHARAEQAQVIQLAKEEFALYEECGKKVYSQWESKQALERVACFLPQVEERPQVTRAAAQAALGGVSQAAAVARMKNRLPQYASRMESNPEWVKAREAGERLAVRAEESAKAQETRLRALVNNWGWAWRLNGMSSEREDMRSALEDLQTVGVMAQETAKDARDAQAKARFLMSARGARELTQ